MRAFSGLASVACLPLVYLAGRRVGGRRAAWAALVVMATSPFALHYATETRMYSLVALEAVVGFRSRPGRLSTETRVHVSDPVSRRKFQRYWRVVRPFSGLIRMSILRAAKRRAEAAA